MAAANVQVVREAIAAFNRGDLDGTDMFVEPDFVVDWSRSHGVEAGVYRGREQTRRFWSTFLETFERVRVECERFIERGDYVLVANRTHFQGRAGIEVVASNVAAVRLRGGRLCAWTLYRDEAEALADLGLGA